MSMYIIFKTFGAAPSVHITLFISTNMKDLKLFMALISAKFNILIHYLMHNSFSFLLSHICIIRF